jgi:hypothetical protein
MLKCYIILVFRDTSPGTPLRGDKSDWDDSPRRNFLAERFPTKVPRRNLTLALNNDPVEVSYYCNNRGELTFI